MANNEKVYDNKKGLRIVFTIFAYVFFIFTAVAVLPVVCPLVFGYHTYAVSSDHTSNGVVSGSSVVYTDKTATDLINGGAYVAINSSDSKKVRVYTVGANNVGDSTITLNTKEVVNYDQVVGKVVAKTPFVGLFTQLCNTIPGIILIAFIFIVGVILTIVANKMVVKIPNDNKTEQ